MGTGWVKSELTAKEYKNFGPGVLDGENFSANMNGNLIDVSNTENVYIQDQERNISYFSLQDEWKINNDLTLTAGLRYDNFSDFGDTLNPRVALVWQASHNLTTKLLYGSAFRAPSFGELSIINNPATKCNSNLKAEEIDTYEFVIDYHPTVNSKLIVNVYSYKATDFIAYVADPAPATTKTAQNSDDQSGQGLEFEFDWQVADSIYWSSSFSYQDTEDAETHTKKPNVPQKQFYTDVRVLVTDDLKVSTQINYIMGRKRAASDPRGDKTNATFSELDDYAVVNLTTSDQVNNQLNLKLIAKNLLDENCVFGSNERTPNDWAGGKSRPIWRVRILFLTQGLLRKLLFNLQKSLKVA